MGKKHLSLEKYFEKIPIKYHNKIILFEDFRGNRTNISFTFSCGCKVEQPLKSFLLRDNFDYCTQCKQQYKETYTCKYCQTKFIKFSMFENCYKKCEIKYKNIVLGEDYVICNICGLHAQSLGIHLTKEHKIDLDKYKESNQIICNKSSDNYSKNSSENSWLSKAVKNKDDLTEYWKKVSDGVSRAILNNPEEIKRRSKLLGEINQTEVMRKKSSDTAKKTSARPEIQKARSEKLSKWREENPEDFYNKCIKKMITTFHSKPERKLFEFVSQLEGFSFKKNRFIKSDLISTKSHYKQIDMGDEEKKIYIEFDGILHFEPKRGFDVLNKTNIKDIQTDQYIKNNNWTIIRISCDQFIYKIKRVNKIKQDTSYFKKECLDKLVEILNSKITGIYKIGDYYGKY